MRFLLAAAMTAMYAVIAYYVILSAVYSAGWGLSMAIWLAIGGWRAARQSNDSSDSRVVTFFAGALPWLFGLGRMIFRAIRTQGA